MKSLMRCLNLTIVLLMAFWGIAVANEWYESMESSGVDQSQSVWKNITTSGSATQGQSAKKAIAEIAESVNKEAAQVAESSVRGQEAYHPSERQEAAATTRQEATATTATSGGGDGGCETQGTPY